MKTFMFAALLAAFATVSHAADRIVAVVNDQVITSNQLNDRTNLNLRQLGLTKANEMQRGAVSKRTLSGLIDEELQRQYATKANIKLSKDDMDKVKTAATQAVGGEASWAVLTKGYEASANDKLAAEALWQKIIARDVQPRVQVSTAEADRLIAELAKSRHVLDREISVIQLSSGQDAATDKAQLDKLTELKGKIDGGEAFAEIARAFSEDKSAVNGGNLGWFGSGELNPQLEEALDKLQPGQISEPIRTPIGWYLVKLENVRTTKPIETDPQTQVEVFLLAAPAPADKAGKKALDSQFDKVIKELKTSDAVRTYFTNANFGDLTASRALGWMVQADLESDLANAVAGSKTGRWSDSITVNGNTARIYVADTKQAMPEKLAAYRDRVMSSIFGNRVELESRRFMQGLRQRAFLDVRM